MAESHKKPCRVAVIGGGAFGTAMADVAASGGNTVIIYARHQEIMDEINANHRNPRILSQFKLHDNITATLDVNEALKGADIVLGCLPSQITPDFLKSIKDIYPMDVPWVSCSKGMNLKEEKFLSEIVDEIFDKEKFRYCVLSGPSFAQEMIEKTPTLVVVASKDEKAAKFVQQALSYRYFRVYTQDDVIGVEVAGALKNILAIGAGIIEGKGYGINTTAAFIARGTKEIYKFAAHYKSDPHTLFGIAGVGDIMLTSFGCKSRNRTFGHRLGKGETMADILKTSSGVVEGVATMKVVVKCAEEFGIDMPITNTIHKMVFDGLKIEEALGLLMERPLEPEFSKQMYSAY